MGKVIHSHNASSSLGNMDDYKCTFEETWLNSKGGAYLLSVTSCPGGVAMLLTLIHATEIAIRSGQTNLKYSAESSSFIFEPFKYI